MLIAILAFVALAATAAVVIRDADPNAGARQVPAAEEAAPAEQPVEQPSVDAPTQATVVGFPEVKPLYDPMVDAPTESMPALMVGAGQAAAILPYAVQIEPEPVVAFDPTSADPDRLIQTVVTVDQGTHSAAVAKLAAGIAISGGVVGLTLIAVGRAISALLGH